MQSLAPLLMAGTAGLGGLGQIINAGQAGGQLNRVKANENLSPQQLGQRVSSATQPLNTGLTEEVGNIVQANMAERGLAQAPGIFAATESQALAPYYQQNQNTALQLISQQLGIPSQALSALLGRPQGDMSNLFALMALRGQGGQQTPGPAPPQNSTSTPTFTDSPIDWGGIANQGVAS